MPGKSIVITRPNHDLTTRYLSAWAQSVMREADEKSHHVVDLKEARARRKEFESVVKKVKPDLIFLNGHGSSKRVLGQDNEPLVELKGNAKILRGAVTYAVSCKSAAQLGPGSVAEGARAYIGYAEDFVFVIDLQRQTKPHHDRVARLFLEPSSRVPLSLLKGNTVAEARERGRSAFRRNIRKLLTSEAETEDSSLLRFLFWDMQHLVAHGDQAARL